MSDDIKLGSNPTVIHSPGMDISMDEWKQIELDFGWTKEDFAWEDGREVSYTSLESMSPRIDGSETEFSVEAEAARINSEVLNGEVWDFEKALARYEASVAPFRPKPEPKSWMYLSRAYTGSSTSAGWRAYSRKSDASRYGEAEKITLFDDGTWSYGIHD